MQPGLESIWLITSSVAWYKKGRDNSNSWLDTSLAAEAKHLAHSCIPHHALMQIQWVQTALTPRLHRWCPLTIEYP